MHAHPAPPPGGASTTRRLPSGAAQVGPWTISSRPGRVYLHADPAADSDLRPAAAVDLAAALLDAALDADAAVLDGTDDDPADWDWLAEPWPTDPAGDEAAAAARLLAQMRGTS